MNDDTSPTTTRELDTSALVGPPVGATPVISSDRAARRAVAQRSGIAILLFLGGGLILWLFIAVFVESWSSGQADLLTLLGGLVLAAVFFALGAYILAVTVTLDVSRLGGPRRRARLQRFAMDNPPLRFVAEAVPSRYPGIPFTKSKKPLVFDVVRFGRGECLEVGNLRSEGTTGNRRIALVQGYVRVPVGAHLPNMLAISKKDRGRSAIPVAIDRGQSVSLEGDFNRYFEFHVPRGYERDALYVFGPDLMALLIDQAEACDVEIVDSWLSVYWHRPLNLLDPRTFTLALRLQASLGSKVARQARRYRDDRAESPRSTGKDGVAHEGRRLSTTGVWLVTTMAVCIVVVGVVAYFLR